MEQFTAAATNGRWWLDAYIMDDDNARGATLTVVGYHLTGHPDHWLRSLRLPAGARRSARWSAGSDTLLARARGRRPHKRLGDRRLSADTGDTLWDASPWSTSMLFADAAVCAHDTRRRQVPQLRNRRTGRVRATLPDDMTFGQIEVLPDRPTAFAGPARRRVWRSPGRYSAGRFLFAAPDVALSLPPRPGRTRSLRTLSAIRPATGHLARLGTVPAQDTIQPPVCAATASRIGCRQRHAPVPARDDST